ncbi:MAG: glycosyltransferase family 4 protein [Nitriliruptoraceae bacterium]|nr:glycosyltransferase family 4 protein [Nitriliruptoraceae bacterium]
MRILEIAPPWFTVPPEGYGGIERVVGGLTDGLVRAGAEVTLFASGGSRSEATLINVFDEPPSRALGSTLHELIHTITAYQRRWSFDVIHDHSGFAGAALASMTDGPPVVHTLHGPWTPEVSRLHALLGDGLHRVAISADQRARTPAGVRVDHMVHNGVDLDTHAFRAQADGDGHLAFVGRANAEKGPEVALRVARASGRHLAMAIKINEREEERYWDTVVAPELVGADVSVIRNGTRQDALDVMSGAEATLFPIAWPEPFGLVMTESMAVGTPVLAYRHGASQELIAPGRTGALLDPGDEAGLIAAVAQAWRYDRSACRARVAEHFSVEAMVRGYLEVFEQVVADAARPAIVHRAVAGPRVGPRVRRAPLPRPVGDAAGVGGNLSSGSGSSSSGAGTLGNLDVGGVT